MKSANHKIKYLVYASNKWNAQWMNHQQLFSRIGKQYNAVCSNGSWMAYSRSKPDFKKASCFEDITKKENVTLNFSLECIPLRMNHNGLYAKIAGTLYNKYINRYFKRPVNKILHLFHPGYNFLRSFIDHQFCIYRTCNDFLKYE